MNKSENEEVRPLMSLKELALLGDGEAWATADRSASVAASAWRVANEAVSLAPNCAYWVRASGSSRKWWSNSSFIWR